MALKKKSRRFRNPGPEWGCGFILWAERWWPRWFFRLAFRVGTWVALAFMPAQRASSRAFLAVVRGRPPRLLEVWRNFFAFAEFLLRKLRAGRGAPVHCVNELENAAEFEALLASEQPALFGTFHFGCSDLLGYQLGARGRRVTIIRLRVDNSTDTELLGQRFGERVSFLWVNERADFLFDLKAAMERGESLALKCDRLEFSAKTAAFHFLGAKRLFPFTIYHLAVLFAKPVVFCVAVPGVTTAEIRVYASPVFVPDAAAGREANLRRGHAHFQSVLTQWEALVRAHPELWFNFIPLNPAVEPTGGG